MSRTPTVFLLLVIALITGCDMPGKPKPADRPVRADEVLDFSLLYGKRCAGCHGADGQLGPAPPLNDPLFLAIVPDAELVRVISEGRLVTPGIKTPMPAFAQHHGGPLTTAQVKALADGIKKQWKADTLVPAGIPPYLQTASESVPEKVPAKLTHEARLKLFTRACANCHGSEGQGGKHGDETVGAINNQDFLALISNQTLRRIIITGRPDLGMPAYDGKSGRHADFQPLTSAEIDELVTLLSQWRQSSPTPK